jgi:hypothetical protein
VCAGDGCGQAEEPGEVGHCGVIEGGFGLPLFTGNSVCDIELEFATSK